MSYSDFKKEQDIKDIGLSVQQEKTLLFRDIQPTPISDWLTHAIRKGVNLAPRSNTEKAKSELLVSEVLSEIWDKEGGGLFSGVPFVVDEKIGKGLTGVLDFAITRENSMDFGPPILAVVEAKNANLKDGLYQVVAEMYAAQMKSSEEETIYGLLTTGFDWQFLTLQKGCKNIQLDNRVYGIGEVEFVYAILKRIVCGA